MSKISRLGFTIIELAVVIAVIAILVTITTVAYRETQKNANNEKYKADTVMLQSAVDEYYADNGDYPGPVCNEGGFAQECHNGQAWNMLVAGGYLKRVPRPSETSHYHWRKGSAAVYGIRVPTKPTECKLSKGVTTGWWGSIAECNF